MSEDQASYGSRVTNIAEYRRHTMPTVCPIQGIPLSQDNAVLDHCHRTGRVRGVISRDANALMGKIENYCSRFMASSGGVGLPQLLGNIADWIEADYSDRPMHPNGIAKEIARFRSMSAGEQRHFLWVIEMEPAKNSRERTKQFAKWIRSTPKV